MIKLFNFVISSFVRETSFVMSKTRIVLLKNKSLPILKLLEALLLARLANYLKEQFKIMNENIFCLSDSRIFLHRNYSNVSNWKVFVANHVLEIQNLAQTQWKFCKGKGKPTDIVSRGCSATELVSIVYGSMDLSYWSENL